ncbi:uncharacterized protein BYT42DRAFT_604106 [Radiomyces spectabilis]|uniref:uncharacterized protein n=1 Tax=Radiomyces spectabilis TaxID=64574 RepID=UPI002220089C|nr:uncharacterized protein BYT42DRAFT_604106 [Radiomyces spectabilis]KAI8381067.1 hypothetical protein BYT42DRAFT_604106 [Radiomyces spectabilis]
MSNPILDNVEYFIQQEEQQRQELKPTNSYDSHSRHHLDPLRRKDSNDTANTQTGDAFVQRWQSLIRRMSVNIQREEGTPDNELVVGTDLHLSDHERQLMLNIPAPSLDDNLPSMEEVAKENAKALKLAELKTSYFEHPFESDVSAPSSVDITKHPSKKSHDLSDPTRRDSKFTGHDGDDQEASQENQENPPSEVVNPKARAQWGRSIEKIRVLNSLSQVTSKPANTHAQYSKIPLAPWYTPALAAPLYMAIVSEDEHDRKAPPILFDVLSVAITDSEIEQSSLHRLWVFRIELQYGEIKWVIKRTILEFYNLHLTLKFKAGISGYLPHPPSFPSQLAHLCNAALTSMRIAREEDQRDEVWRDVTLKRREALEQYLKDLVQGSRMCVNYDLCEFLEISAISIVKDMGWKGKEGYLEHKMNSASPSLMQLVRRSRWAKEWIILRDSYIAFCKDIDSSTPSDVLLFDSHFKFKRGHSAFAPYQASHITLCNSSRRIEIKGPTNRHIEDWVHSLRKIEKESPWVANHRFGSYAPIRENAKVKWFVDGEDYFAAVAEAILSAKSDIYIEDWWLSPQLYLRRPPKGNEEYRIDRLLKRKASEGVMIYIVIYKNISMALPLDSQHTRDWLQNAHPNIIVQRHANLTSAFWAHHEKILVVDYRLAFVGGFDLCFGRYDTPSHDLTDYCSDDPCNSEIFPGQDYSNPRVKDFTKVSQYDMELIDRKMTPRMPWHDVHTAMVGPPARDIARHFIQRWNFIKSTRAKDRNSIPFLMPKGEYVAARDESKFRGTCRVQVVRSSAEWSLGIVREYSIYKAYMECISKAKHYIYIENQFFITATHPEDKLIKNKIGQAIVERIKRAHRERKKFRVFVVIPCAPGFEGDFTTPDKRSMALRSVAHYQYLSISRGGSSILETLYQENIPAERYIGFYSLRNWGRIKHSAAKAAPPPPCTDDATPISPTSSTSAVSDPLPQKSDSRRNSGGVNRSNSGRQPRTRRARARSSLASLATIKSGNNSGIEDPVRSRSDGSSGSNDRGDMNDGRMDIVTEQVYIHSKLLIVDDKTVICGSANLNDRSQLGNRDSEIAVVIEDSDLVSSTMNGQPYKAARYALTLRMHLFKEHLGLLKSTGTGHATMPHRTVTYEDQLVTDPLSDDLHNLWHDTAEKNTNIYQSVFRCVPDDTVYTYDAHRRFVPDPARVPYGHIAQPWRLNNEEVEAKLADIRGHLVLFPTHYLCQENLTSSIVQEAVPPTVFT